MAQKKPMTCLKLPRGRVTTSPSEMRSCAMDYYTDLFRAEQCSLDCREELLEGLPQLTQKRKASLDRELTLEELNAAVNQLALGRAPGIDGLSADVLKGFWNILLCMCAGLTTTLTLALCVWPWRKHLEIQIQILFICLQFPLMQMTPAFYSPVRGTSRVFQTPDSTETPVHLCSRVGWTRPGCC